MNRRAAAVLLVVGAVLAACGSGSSGTSAKTTNDLSVDVASYDVAIGPPSRITVGVQTAGSKLVTYGTADLRFTYLGTEQAPTATTVFTPPVTATYLPLPGTTVPQPPPTEPRAVLATEARGVYAAQAAFDRAGFWGVEVSLQLAGQTHRGRAAFPVVAKHAVPAPGDPAPATDTLTISTPGVDKASIDSRAGTGGEVPDPELHTTSLAAALAAHRPAVVVFSTPVFCQSQFCGPVTDMVDELSKTYADRATFIHVEIWKNGEKKEFNQAVKDWNMDNEPWVYLIGADGKIILRLDNVATRAELEPYLQQLPVIGPAA